MKKIMNVIGLVSAMAASMGICFKLLHLQGNMFLTTYGVLIFSLVYVPWQVAVWHKANPESTRMEKVMLVFALLYGVITGAAIIMALSRFDSTVVQYMFFAGAIFFSFGFLPLLFFKLYKKAVAKPVA
ncbi:MAG TPA: hypothetical protein VGK59_02290 [Ohtaekwangia sp.]